MIYYKLDRLKDVNPVLVRGLFCITALGTIQ